MRTLCRSLFGFRVVLLSLAAALLLLAPGLQGAASAQYPPCNAALLPMCDGICPPGDGCADIGGDMCGCVPDAPPCGLMAGPPMCYGDCPPHIPVCIFNGLDCECVIPTLSEWGIIGMSLVMFGGVLFLRRRRFDSA